MDHLKKAQEIVGGFSGKAIDLQAAQAHATIALAEAAQDITRKLALINSSLATLVTQGKESTSASEAQANEPKARATRRKASEK